MNKTANALLAAVSLLIFGCQSKSKKNYLPEIFTCDSAVVMYYNTPGNPRFFKMHKLYNKDLWNNIAEDANSRLLDKNENCITEGKIYFYGKSGAVEVLYFSREEKCKMIYFIKTGEKYYTRLSKTSALLLNKWKESAIEPKAAE
jgi:hypothetical protein